MQNLRAKAIESIPLGEAVFLSWPRWIFQTLGGKLPIALARRARVLKIPVIAAVGTCRLSEVELPAILKRFSGSIIWVIVAHHEGRTGAHQGLFPNIGRYFLFLEICPQDRMK